LCGGLKNRKSASAKGKSTDEFRNRPLDDMIKLTVESRNRCGKNSL